MDQYVGLYKHILHQANQYDSLFAHMQSMLFFELFIIVNFLYSIHVYMHIYRERDTIIIHVHHITLMSILML